MEEEQTEEQRCPVCFSRDLESVFIYDGVTIRCSKLYGATEQGCQTCWAISQAVLHYAPKSALLEANLSVYAFMPRLSFTGFGSANDEGVQFEIFTNSALDSTSGQGLPFLTLPSGDTGSEKALQTAKDWIQTCISTHEGCGLNPTTNLPTRVLDLGEDSDLTTVKLYISQRENARYTCLSHCWGTHPNPTMLRRENLDSWVKGLPITELPTMYQQAALVTKRLGIRYLWIDSLCIIQDEIDDWQNESRRMADMYHNSFLTIAATCSVDETDPMFRKNSPPYFPKQISSRSKAPLFCRQAFPDHEPLFDSSVQLTRSSSLFRRAWIYQERLLSPRVLHFTSEELIFECSEDTKCECGYRSRSNCTLKKDHRKMLVDKNGSHHAGWHRIVEEYSKLNLTFAKDKFPALSGIVKQIEAAYGDTYMAGLWLPRLDVHLSWYAEQPKIKNQEWRAPSWSWAAVDGPVVFLFRRTPYAPITTLNILEVVCEPAGVDPHGELKSGHLKLSGHVTEALLRLDNPREFILMVGNKRFCGYMYSDYLLYDGTLVLQPIPCALVWIGIQDYRNQFLILVHIEGREDDVYERIGLFDSEFNEEIPNFETKTIVII